MSESMNEVKVDKSAGSTVQSLKNLLRSHRRQVVIGVIVILFCALAVWTLFRPRYVAVLSTADKGTLTQMQAELQTLNIPSHIAGTSLLVPATDIERLVQPTVKGAPPVEGQFASGTGTGNTQNSAGTVNLPLQDLPVGEVALTQGLEQRITKQLTAGLNRILGPGNAVVMVHANVTFDQVKTTTQVSQPAVGKTKAAHSSVNTEKLSDPMQVHGYTVGVILNAYDKQVTAQTLTEIQSFVRSAVGLSAGSGSENDISVMSIPFRRYGAAGFPWLRNPWADLGWVSLLIVMGSLLVTRLRQQRLRARAKLPSAATGSPADTEDGRFVQELAELAIQRPDEFANLLRTWLTD